MHELYVLLFFNSLTVQPLENTSLKLWALLDFEVSYTHTHTGSLSGIPMGAFLGKQSDCKQVRLNATWHF